MTVHEEFELIVTLLNLLANEQRKLSGKFDKLMKTVKKRTKKRKRF